MFDPIHPIHPIEIKLSPHGKCLSTREQIARLVMRWLGVVAMPIDAIDETIDLMAPPASLLDALTLRAIALQAAALDAVPELGFGLRLRRWRRRLASGWPTNEPLPDDFPVESPGPDHDDLRRRLKHRQRRRHLAGVAPIAN